MKRNFTEFKNIHKGQDIWVIAAGATMDYISPSFFENKITIGINHVFHKYICNYYIRKEKWHDEEMIDFFSTHPQCKLLVPKHESGHMGLSEYNLNGHFDYWVFEHGWLGGAVGGVGLKLGALDMDELIVSGSTITSGIHLAYYMGACNIILCGHDCGYLDNRVGFQEYPTTEGRHPEWLHKIETDSIELRNELGKRGVNVYSLNPFINIGLEKHTYNG